MPTRTAMMATRPPRTMPAIAPLERPEEDAETELVGRSEVVVLLLLLVLLGVVLVLESLICVVL